MGNWNGRSAAPDRQGVDGCDVLEVCHPMVRHGDVSHALDRLVIGTLSPAAHRVMGHLPDRSQGGLRYEGWRTEGDAATIGGK
jgi:hypothetical protein